VAILALLFGFSRTGRADVIIFSNKAEFLTATGATSATGPLPNLGLVPGGETAMQTVGTVTFSISPPSTQLFIGALGNPLVVGGDWTTRLPGADIAISGLENLNAALTAPVFSLGFDFVEPENDPNIFAPFIDSTFEVTLLMGSTVVDSFTFNAPNDTAAFVGVWSNHAFDRAEIRETVGGIENEFFGQFYTGTNPLQATPVPEPSTLALFGLGTLALIGYGWRRRKQVCETGSRVASQGTGKPVSCRRSGVRSFGRDEDVYRKPAFSLALSRCHERAGRPETLKC
jgi:hypothetical protein